MKKFLIILTVLLTLVGTTFAQTKEGFITTQRDRIESIRTTPDDKMEFKALNTEEKLMEYKRIKELNNVCHIKELKELEMSLSLLRLIQRLKVILIF